MDKIISIRNKTLKHLANKLESFYLAGGTALSLYYFQHRESYDLDFFTKNFSRVKIEEIMSGLSKDIELKAALEGEENKQGFAKMLVYSLIIDENNALKIDFVEDVYRLLKPLRVIDGIPVLTIEDVYFRKILTACGSIASVDPIGRSAFIGGRQEAKDFFDLYFLSTTFSPLSKFALGHCSYPQIESLAVWYRTYGRSSMQMDILDIETDKSVSFREMDNHFKREIEQLVRKAFE